MKWLALALWALLAGPAAAQGDPYQVLSGAGEIGRAHV